MDLSKEYSFEAAHYLPRVPLNHKCRRTHGHSYRIRVHLSGDLDKDLGWVTDFAAISDVVKPVVAQLDHRFLNEIPGLENPTSENVAIWIWKEIAETLPGLKAIEISETCTSGCRYEGPKEAAGKQFVPPSSPTPSPQNAAQSKESPPSASSRPASSVDREDSVTSIFRALQNWKPKPAEVPVVVSLTARSLDTVTKLTQYEDEKANRILTAVAFLSAFVGVLFATVPRRFPPASIDTLWHLDMPIKAALLAGVYVTFATYAVLVATGAAFVIWAVKPRFKTSKNWTSTEEPKSFLFFERIAEMDPRHWGEAFAKRAGDQLSVDYAKQSIAETYLISKKIGDKVKWLKKGVWFFFLAAMDVALFAVLTVMTLAVVKIPPNTNPSTMPAATVTTPTPLHFKHTDVQTTKRH